MLWKGRVPPWVPPSQNYCSTHMNGHVVFTWVYHMNLRCCDIISSSNHVDQKKDLQFIKILSKSYAWCEHQSQLRMIVKKSEKLDHRTSESNAYDCHTDYQWQYLEPKTCFEGRISVFCFFGTPVRRFLKYSRWTPRKKLSDQTFPFQPVISVPPVQSSKMICYNYINHQPKFFKPWFIQFKPKYV